MEARVSRKTPDRKVAKKLPPGSIHLRIAGDLILTRFSSESREKEFLRFGSAFESYANMSKTERILNYKIMNALMLTSYARRADTKEKKRALFAMKNKLFLSIATNPAYRKHLSFRYLLADKIRVVSYCDSCLQENEAKQEPRHKWKYCESCETDPEFFNIISMIHKGPGYRSCIYLSHDHLKQLPFSKPRWTGSLSDSKEHLIFGKYRYSTNNLTAIDFDSVLQMYEKFLPH
ncbi:MAG: hypothetical protein H6618_00615 [Deltaproteobacteria bacterium]|nr:hypothetical protein [Deltaproteobacteria bacterium]